MRAKPHPRLTGVLARWSHAQIGREFRGRAVEVVELVTQHDGEQVVRRGPLGVGARRFFEIGAGGTRSTEGELEGRDEVAQREIVGVLVQIRRGVVERGAIATRADANLDEKRCRTVGRKTAGDGRRRILFGAHEIVVACAPLRHLEERRGRLGARRRRRSRRGACAATRDAEDEQGAPPNIQETPHGPAPSAAWRTTPSSHSA